MTRAYVLSKDSAINVMDMKSTRQLAQCGLCTNKTEHGDPAQMQGLSCVTTLMNLSALRTALILVVLLGWCVVSRTEVV